MTKNTSIFPQMRFRRNLESVWQFAGARGCKPRKTARAQRSEAMCRANS